MKRISLLLLGACILILQVNAQSGDDIVYIPDTAFLYALIDVGVDTNEDSLISFAEAEAVNFLDVGERGITDVTGIEAFVTLDTFLCYINNIEILKMPSLPELTILACSYNPIDSLDISNVMGLKELSASHCNLTSLDLSNNPLLEDVYCNWNQLSSLDVSMNVNLRLLGCLYNSLESLDVSGCVNLELMGCHDNNLKSLDVSNNLKLKSLWCLNNPNIGTLNVSRHTSLEILNCSNCGLTSLILPDSSALTDLDCYENFLESIDVSGCPKLEYFVPFDNNLTSLDVTNNPLLDWLSCEDNQLITLDVSNNPELNYLWCGDNLLTTLDLTNNTKLGSIPDETGNLNVDNMPTLGEVCVWDGFPGDAEISYEGCPNICFETDCDGCCGNCTGIEGLDDSGLMIYPNPTTDLLTIETTSFGPHSIQIHSLNGQEIYATTFTGDLLELDLSSFRKGIYFLHIRSDKHTTTKKVVKL